MPDLQQLLLFIAAGWLLNLTSGPDVLYILLWLGSWILLGKASAGHRALVTPDLAGQPRRLLGAIPCNAACTGSSGQPPSCSSASA
jgi:hypothetical protein